MDQIIVNENQEQDKKPKQMGFGTAAFVGFGSLILVLVVGFFLPPNLLGGSKPQQKAQLTTYDFIDGCKAQILKLVKSPKATQFEDENVMVSRVMKINNTLLLRTSIDSPNSFGALLKADVVCVYDFSSNQLKVTFEKQ